MSKKVKSAYICQSCEFQSAKWLGQCPSCNEWNTFIEEAVGVTSNSIGKPMKLKGSRSVNINEIQFSNNTRININNQELNRILGGGLVPGSLTLLGGEPGIGKSTLGLQVALNSKELKTLYISGEESANQIKLRAERVGINNQNCFVLCETSLEDIIAHIEHDNSDFVIIDSIQTIHSMQIESSPGSISQVRECTNEILRIAKRLNKPILLIGHITKDGHLAGPKVLEHIVDTVLLFEGDQNFNYRIIRVIKNRFGSTSEIGIFEMQENGLREVTNPSEILLSNSNEYLSGTSIAVTINGIRPFLVEIQALVSSAVYGTPQRSSTGYDLRRLNMLLAVLEKRAGFRLAHKDVFLNIAGGIKVTDPAIDLAIIVSILSSDQDIKIQNNICFSGEISLTGEIRPVNKIEQRISEAEKLGFNTIYISKFNTKLAKKKHKIEIVQVAKIEELFRHIFG